MCIRDRHKSIESNSYTVIDVETTGLSPHKDQIIELAALKIENGSPIKDIALLIKIAEKIPASITKLTGITNDMLSKEGQNLENALKIFLEFIESDLLVCHNASFDIGFIQAACRKANLPIPHNQCVDTFCLLYTSYIQGRTAPLRSTIPPYAPLLYDTRIASSSRGWGLSLIHI